MRFVVYLEEPKNLLGISDNRVGLLFSEMSFFPMILGSYPLDTQQVSPKKI